ncbi:MAG: ankyrin repeat domain-containing protein [bacterium]
MNLGKKTIIALTFCLLTSLAIQRESKANALVALATNHKIATGLVTGATVAVGTGLYKFIPYIVKETIKNIDLRYAVATGDIKTVNKLLNEATNNDPTTLLHLASKKGQFEVAQILIENGANVNAKNIDGETPLHIAVRIGDEKLTNLLLNQENIELSPVNNLGQTPFAIAQKLKGINIIKLLAEKASGTTVNMESILKAL